MNWNIRHVGRSKGELCDLIDQDPNVPEDIKAVLKDRVTTISDRALDLAAHRVISVETSGHFGSGEDSASADTGESHCSLKVSLVT